MPIRGWIGHTCFYSSRLKTRTSGTDGLAPLSMATNLLLENRIGADPRLVKRNNAQ